MLAQLSETQFTKKENERFFVQKLAFFENEPALYAFLKWRPSVVTSLVEEAHQAVGGRAKMYFLSLLPHSGSWLFGVDLKAITGLCEGALVCSYDCGTQKQEKTEATKNETNEVIRRVKNYIYDHMEDVTLELAAESVRMNPQYLSSYFHQQTGEKFGDYLLKKRMKEAARLLVRSSMRIQEIAVRVGYSTANSFSRSFRQFYGMTPKEYRLRRGENSDE